MLSFMALLRDATIALLNLISSPTVSLEKNNSPFIPFDVLYLIAGHADSGSLHTFSLLNKDCNHIASQHLWKEVNIQITFSSRNDRGPSMSLLKAIAAQPGRARCIRHLTITIAGGSRSLEDHRRHQKQWDSLVVEGLTLALQHAELLKSMRLEPHYFGSQLAQVLDRPFFPFSLVALESPLEIMHNLVPFLSKQSSIKHWSISNAYIKTQSAHLPPHVLPNLESVRTTPPHFATVAAGRPVHTLDLTGTSLRPSYAGYLDMKAIGSTSHLLRLKVSLDAISRNSSLKDDITRLEILPPVVPHLRRLDVHCVLTFPAMDSSARVLRKEYSQAGPRAGLGPDALDAMDRFARTLGLFRELKELEWTSGTDTLDVPRCGRWEFVDKCQRECPTLERIVIDGHLMDSTRRRDIRW